MKSKGKMFNIKFELFRDLWYYELSATWSCVSEDWGTLRGAGDTSHCP